MTEQQAVSKRFPGTVAVWFSTHYQRDDRDWNNIREFDGAYHPLIGYYRSDDLRTLREQLRGMRRAGIDTIVYDCYGTAEFELTDLPNDRALALLTQELAHQDDEPRKLSLIIWLEKYFVNPTLDSYRFALHYVREHLTEQPYYYRYDGKPLVVTYHNGNNDSIDEIEWDNDYFSLRRIRPYNSDVWSYVDNYPQRLNREWMVASPGFDAYLELAYVAKYYHKEPNPDFAKIREESAKHAAGREEGEFFRKQLLRARYGDPRIIFISGWNDWQYANHIEPAVEYEYRYVDQAARLLGRESETAPYR